MTFAIELCGLGFLTMTYPHICLAAVTWIMEMVTHLCFLGCKLAGVFKPGKSSTNWKDELLTEYEISLDLLKIPGTINRRYICNPTLAIVSTTSDWQDGPSVGSNESTVIQAITLDTTMAWMKSMVPKSAGATSLATCGTVVAFYADGLDWELRLNREVSIYLPIFDVVFGVPAWFVDLLLYHTSSFFVWEA